MTSYTPGQYGAANYMLNTVGGMNEQYTNVFAQGGDSSLGGNAIHSLTGQIAGGRKRRNRRTSRHSKYSRKRGGFMGSMLNQAVVPLALLGMQQTYKRRGTHYNNKKNTYRRGSRRRSRRR